MKYRKKLIIIILISLVYSGCSNKNLNERGQEQKIAQNQNDAILEDSKKIAELYRNICERGTQNGISGLDMEKQIVQYLGENGYVAIDNENQIDMVNSEKVNEFLEKVETKGESQLTIICVMYNQGFIRYDLQTEKGNVQVLRSSHIFNGSTIEVKYSEDYPAHTWVYSKEGYLFFEQYHMAGFDGPSGHTAIRVKALDETCRELNRKYLIPIGYELNNLFTSDWNENDYQGLNSYDLYERLYRIKYSQSVLNGFWDEGITYEIPQSEFEEVFEMCFQIDSKALRQRTIYCETTGTYQYRSRGMYDCAPTPNIPYPEVIAYEENEDKTIKLIINAVWPEKNLGKAFSHEVVVRLLENDKFQYVSNRVIPSEENAEITWYTERLSDEEWQEYYGERQ